MSKFMRFIVGSMRSNSNQFNGIMVAIWAALSQSDFIASKPEYVAIFGGIQAVMNILLRAKTKKPLTER